MLENVLAKPETTTINELNYDHAKAREVAKNESMFLATGGKFSLNTHVSNFYITDKSGYGLTTAKKDYENPVFDMQEKYL